SIFDAASERYKCKILRACAREPLRQTLLTQLVYTWLKESSARQLVAYELMHAVARGTPWFVSELKSIIERANRFHYQSTQRSGKAGKPLEQLYFKALRFDLLWEHHRDAL